jgi:hypothetical protein
VILIVYPPGWITLYPAHPLGIATLASFLQSEGIACRQVDLEILAHEANRSSLAPRIDLNALLDSSRFSALLKHKEGRNLLHESYATIIGPLLDMADTTGIRAVVFSILGERQFIAASILASHFRAQGLPVMAGGCYIRQHAARVAALGIFDVLFTGFDMGRFADACRNAMQGLRLADNTSASRIESQDSSLDLVPQPRFDPELAGCYRRAVKEIYKTEREHLILQYLLDLGCTYRCSFCTRFHRKYERKAVSKIVAEISELATEHRTRLFSFTTNGVNFEAERSLPLYRELSHSLRGLAWHAYAVPNLVNPALVDAIASSGCRILRFGLESAGEKMLRFLHKGFTPRQAARSFELAHRAGIWVQVNFMVGCPQETEEDIEENCRFIEQYSPIIDSIRINPFFLQYDSDISNRPEHYGIRLRPWSGSSLGFDEIGGLAWEGKVEATAAAIQKMYSVMSRHNIGFDCISSHLLLCALEENGSKKGARDWLRRVHPYLGENLPPEWIQWRIYHAHELDKCPYSSEWKANCGLIYEKGLEELRR